MAISLTQGFYMGLSVDYINQTQTDVSRSFPLKKPTKKAFMIIVEEAFVLLI